MGNWPEGVVKWTDSGNCFPVTGSQLSREAQAAAGGQMAWFDVSAFRNLIQSFGEPVRYFVATRCICSNPLTGVTLRPCPYHCDNGWRYHERSLGSAWLAANYPNVDISGGEVNPQSLSVESVPAAPPTENFSGTYRYAVVWRNAAGATPPVADSGTITVDDGDLARLTDIPSPDVVGADASDAEVLILRTRRDDPTGSFYILDSIPLNSTEYIDGASDDDLGVLWSGSTNWNVTQHGFQPVSLLLPGQQWGDDGPAEGIEIEAQCSVAGLPEHSALSRGDKVVRSYCPEIVREIVKRNEEEFDRLGSPHGLRLRRVNLSDVTGVSRTYRVGTDCSLSIGADGVSSVVWSGEEPDEGAYYSVEYEVAASWWVATPQYKPALRDPSGTTGGTSDMMPRRATLTRTPPGG